jgi:uncharacterized protein YfiM (DUF2279 family)
MICCGGIHMTMRHAVLATTISLGAEILVALATTLAPGQPDVRRRSVESEAEHAIAMRIHLILVGDTRSSGVGKAVRVNMGLIEQLLRTQSGEILQVHRIVNPTRNPVVQTLAQLPVSCNDTVFVYTSTHGRYRDGNIELLLGDDLVKRSEVLDIVKKRSARLTVMFSDTLSLGATLPRPQATVATAEVAPRKLLHGLLTAHHGVIDLEGTTPSHSGIGGEFGIYLADDTHSSGGIFTRSFFDAAQTGSASSWPDLFDETCEKTQATFAQAIPPGLPVPSLGGHRLEQRSQTPRLRR